MSDENTQSEERSARSRAQEMRSELQDLRSDVLEVKDTFQNERHNTKNKFSYKFGKHKRKIAIGLMLAVIGYFVFVDDSFTIPNWAIVLAIGLIVGSFVAYVPAKRLAEKFVTDNRVPILELNATDFDEKEGNIVGVHAVPQEKIPEMEVYEGDLHDMQTQEYGRGYQVERYAEIQQNGEEHIIAKGTWMGEKSSMELAKSVGEIEGMRKNLKPKAQTGFAYEIMWPSIMQELQSSVANMITREIEGITIFKGDELRTEIDEITEEYKPEKITERAAKEDLEDQIENSDSEEIEVSEENTGMLDMLD